MACTRFQTDGMKFLDGEMGPQEREQYESHVRGCEVCATELRELGRVVNLTNEIRLREPDEQFWADYWRSVYRRLERGFGFFLLAAGLVVLTAVAIYKVVTSPGFFSVWGIAAAVVVLGFWIVFVSVVRERYYEEKDDPYKGVQR